MPVSAKLDSLEVTVKQVRRFVLVLCFLRTVTSEVTEFTSQTNGPE